jgi:tetratricopeptide (TPR) repeat protein
MDRGRDGKDLSRASARLRSVDVRGRFYSVHRFARAEARRLRQQIREQIKSNPYDFDVHFGEGLLSLKLGDNACAISAFSRAIQLDPDRRRRLRGLLQQKCRALSCEPPASAWTIMTW